MAKNIDKSAMRKAVKTILTFCSENRNLQNNSLKCKCPYLIKKTYEFTNGNETIGECAFFHDVYSSPASDWDFE